MTWTAPYLFSTSELITSTIMNTYVEANLAYLQNFGKTDVSTSETTASTGYTPLTTAQAVTVTTGTSALVSISAWMQHTTASASCFMGYAISGATTVAAADTAAIEYECYSTATDSGSFGAVFIKTGLTAGSNTFTAKFRISSGSSGTFKNRQIAVWALPS